MGSEATTDEKLKIRNIRVSDDDWALWTKAAQMMQGHTRADWMRSVLSEAARSELQNKVPN